ncbi:MAG: hypothetical protein ACYS5V_12270 [Planctomycetota bacterium]|jgi:hypothetical protein
MYYEQFSLEDRATIDAAADAALSLVEPHSRGMGFIPLIAAAITAAAGVAKAKIQSDAARKIAKTQAAHEQTMATIEARVQQEYEEKRRQELAAQMAEAQRMAALRAGAGATAGQIPDAAYLSPRASTSAPGAESDWKTWLPIGAGAAVLGLAVLS